MSNLRPKVRPPALAKRWTVGVDKVHYLIHTGLLPAFDCSLNPGTGRPRYLIDEKDIEAFEQSRMVTPPAPRATRRRRRRDLTVREYF